MFATATRNFVEEVDHGGLLIPVSSLNDTIAALTVVVKRKRLWLWQRPKYIPTDFKLNDILSGDTPINPEIIETDFIKYNGTFGDNIQATMEANLAHPAVNSNVSLHGKDSSKLQSSFGSLKKEEVDVQKLLRDSKDRVLDMSHSLVQQTKEKHRQSFGVVKERVVTTQPCSVIEEVQQGGDCAGGLAFCGPKNPKVSLKENGSLSKDSNVTMEIPVHTTIAYALIELEIKHNGHYELCLMSDTKGGFEVDGPICGGLLGVSGAPVDAAGSSCIRRELEQLSDHFQQLSALPIGTRSSLLQHIAELMEDREAIASLQSVLDQMCRDERPALDDVTTTDSHKQAIRAVLDLVEQADPSAPALTAVHLVTSAMDEMTNEGLAALRSCCSAAELQALELLVQCVSGKGEMPLSSAGLAALTGGVYEKAEQLFASSDVWLKRDGDTARIEINQQPGKLPLVLCIAVRGLASLAQCV